MKRFLFLIAMALAISVPAQSFNHQLLDMPEAVFDAANGVVFTAKTYGNLEIVPTSTRTTRNGVTTTRTGNTIRWNQTSVLRPTDKRAAVGVYGLNLIHDYLHAYDFEYQGTNDSALVFTNCNQEAYFAHNNGKVLFTVVTHHEVYTSIRNNPAKPSEKIFVHFTRQQVDSLCKRIWRIDILEMERRAAMRFYGEYRDPATNLVSFFTYASIENGKVINKTFVNGKPYDQVNLSALRTANNKTGFSFQFNWRFHNECLPTGTSSGDMSGIGNAGRCGDSGYFERTHPFSQSVNYTVGTAYNYNKVSNTATFAADKSKWVVLYIGEKPISGKEASSACYVNIDTGTVSTHPG